MRILVTGARGILGQAVRECLAPRNTLYLWERSEVDIRDPAQVAAAAKGIEFGAVIHTAAFTQVDRCESEYDLALATNRDGTRHVAALARDRGAPFVYVSTDYVFDGTKDGPYVEDDPPHPVNAYGRSKLAGEEAARETGGRVLIVRTSWLFGAGGKNFVDTIADRLERGESPEVVTDQRGSPTYARDLAKGIEKLLCKGATGVVHVANRGSTTWHGLAVAIAHRLGASVPIVETTSDRFPRPARRPANSVLLSERYRDLTGEAMPPWEDALADHLSRRAAIRKGAAA
jgi:dTDP-4-dehydrorhamnose reductase